LSLKVKLKLSPGDIEPLSNAPDREDTVWVTDSWFNQVTVVPGVTVSVSGEKVKLSIITSAVGPGVKSGPGVPPVGGVVWVSVLGAVDVV